MYFHHVRAPDIETRFNMDIILHFYVLSHLRFLLPVILCRGLTDHKFRGYELHFRRILSLDRHDRCLYQSIGESVIIISYACQAWCLRFRDKCVIKAKDGDVIRYKKVRGGG